MTTTRSPGTRPATDTRCFEPRGTEDFQTVGASSLGATVETFAVPTRPAVAPFTASVRLLICFQPSGTMPLTVAVPPEPASVSPILTPER